MINSGIAVTYGREISRGFVVRAEMFGQLTSGLESAWNKLKGEGPFPIFFNLGKMPFICFFAFLYVFLTILISKWFSC